jgi:hypothetical protein
MPNGVAGNEAAVKCEIDMALHATPGEKRKACNPAIASVAFVDEIEATGALAGLLLDAGGSTIEIVGLAVQPFAIGRIKTSLPLCFGGSMAKIYRNPRKVRITFIHHHSHNPWYWVPLKLFGASHQTNTF